mmetsp:Transcript_47794/g.152713  ORF Transcript_47794/g.152713 Transcript_47794/m.152713 type:complete len:133 (+) Transcript_47794:3-401(+)
MPSSMISPRLLVDLIGGNGSWRQHKAEVELEKRRLKDAEALNARKLAAEKRRRHGLVQVEKKRKQLEDHGEWVARQPLKCETCTWASVVTTSILDLRGHGQTVGRRLQRNLQWQGIFGSSWLGLRISNSRAG